MAEDDLKGESTLVFFVNGVKIPPTLKEGVGLMRKGAGGISKKTRKVQKTRFLQSIADIQAEPYLFKRAFIATFDTQVVDNQVDPEWTLLYYLRQKLRLCGTKLGCAEGGCGACTVMVSRYHRKKKKVIHLAVNACLAAICTMHGCAVTTVEGIGSIRTKLHPVQERLAKAHGSQCGFCTPGIIMSMYALIRANPKPKMMDMEIAFQGNLCRCTGYRPIIEGLRTFTEEWEREQAQIAERMNAITNGVNGSENGHGVNGHGVNGHGVNGHGENGNGVNGHGVNGHGVNGHGVNGNGVNGHAVNGNGVNGLENGNGVNGHGVNGHGVNGNGVNGHGVNGSENGNGINGSENGHGVNGNGVNGHGVNGHGVNGHGVNGHGVNGNGVNGNGVNGNGVNGNGVNGHGVNGHGVNGHGVNGHGVNGNGVNGHGVNGHGVNGNGVNGHGVNGNGINGSENGNGVNGTEKGNAVKGMENEMGVTNGFGCGMGKNCCKNNKKGYYRDPEEILFSRSEFTPWDPSQEAIFPPELMLDSQLDEQVLVIKGPRATWYRPTKFRDVLNLKKKYPQAKIINGNSEVGVEVKFKNFLYPVLVHPLQVEELTEVVYLKKGIRFGAAVTINEINDIMREQIATQPESKTRIFKAACGILHWFAGKQIRNVSAIGGNIMTGSPISDMNPVLMAANADLYVESTESSRVIKMDHTFFTGYRRNVIKPEEVLTAVVIPYSHEDQYFMAYKQAKRRDDDIAIVNCAANVEFEPNSDVVKNIYIAYGGVAACTTLAMKTREKIIGKRWNDEMIEEAFTSLIEELPLPPNAPGGMIRYRRSLTLSLFFKFYLYVRDRLSKKYNYVETIPERIKSAIPGFHSGELKSSQYFQVVPKHQSKVDAVGRPIVHVNALKQATGEAIYLDDIPKVEKELYATLVTSTKAHAKVLKIDTSQALAMPGVHGFFCDKIMENRENAMGPIFHDEKIFYTDEVTSQGQVIGVIVADTQAISQRAAKAVKIEYEELSPVIVSIEQAIEHESYIGGVKKIVRGDVEEAFKTCDYVREEEVRMGGQEHFYLETHCCLVVPKEDELEVFSSSQNAAEIQKEIAHAVGIPINRVVVRVKRIGGGFGGKESRASVVAVPLSLIAYKIKRPIRCMLDRDEDMMVSGTRHPFMGRYKVGFNKDGKVIAFKADIYCNAGYSMDLTCGVFDRALFHIDNAYYIPNLHVQGRICLTNLPSNTAFRGFGGPQGMFFCECMIDAVANTLNRAPEEIRYLNLYKEGHTTHYNQLLTHCTMTRCWEECYENGEYEKKKAEIEEFNRKNRYKKRGISLIPTKFGIAFTELSLNQAGALVHVYTDGSVLLSHGGIEMGQGLNTKMIQVASKSLGVDASNIFISEMASDKVPNSSATAASSGSDLNGMAVMNACHKIRKRLEPFMKDNPQGTWKDWCLKAYKSRVGLSATGFYMTPEIGYSFETNSGMAFNYYTYGAALSVVEIDCLSGDHQVLRTDIVMDLGESLNPAIDIGQIEGAFVQGQGLFTMEELLYSPTGTIFTRGPGTYKIPGFADIPLEFNVSLLRGAPNPRAVYSSKAVGEPPLFLASSVFFAIKNAIRAARLEEGIKGDFRFDSPATSWRIRMNCVDKITQKFPEPDPKSYTPWNLIP